MPAFLLTFLTVALAMFAGREAVRVARLAQGGMAIGPLLAAITGAAVLASALAAWLAGGLAGIVSGEYRAWLVAAALALAAVEVAILASPSAPREPTASLGATAIVLLAGVATDASGLLILSLALATGEPYLAAAGGALAVAGVLAFAAIAGEDWERMPRKALRWLVVLALVVGAGVVALAGRSLF
ncbi:hypothetical protein GRI62_10430 [Erythrobacter arachoides]|uniref:GDT1 family protein n=1 Tax=Aurantiacibacter arachoides TaxID=1850444 RepID=A0A845A509_9SPHN|nr:hypothetical protein [Aurantiacibacter arachoides]MXO94017.1 hypothetical protein [Aurantiacibacter arachoides]GGD44729.1 hypothetical protein GCM10011411_00490 [Aurantiacibacter arachoides]